MTAQGTCRSLVIYCCEPGDQGMYVCDAGDAQSSAFLKVQGEPDLAVPGRWDRVLGWECWLGLAFRSDRASFAS